MTSTPFSTDNFPKPDEVDMFLAWDNLHAPRPMTPLSTIITQHLGDGFTAAMNEYAQQHLAKLDPAFAAMYNDRQFPEAAAS